eukprot:5725397-Amphidinium_carterae.2
MHELVNADVVEDVEVLKVVLGDLGVVELVVALDVAVNHDMLKFEGVLVDVDANIAYGEHNDRKDNDDHTRVGLFWRSTRALRAQAPATGPKVPVAHGSGQKA